MIENDPDKAELIAKQIFRLSLMSQKHMSADELKDFLKCSFELLEMM
jgi:hypothetical protein